MVDKHAPVKEKIAVIPPTNPWINDEIPLKKRKIRKAERTWRKRKLMLGFQIYQELLRSFNDLLKRSKRSLYCDKISDAVEVMRGLLTDLLTI